VAAVLLLARRDLLHRWRSALAITMLVGVVGAIVLASAAGAHRSASALDRFVAFSRPSDIEIDLGNTTAEQLREFRRLPEVTDFAVLHAFADSPRGAPNLKNAASVDGRLGLNIDRARLIAGRAPDPNAVDEINIGEGFAAQMHLGVGDDLVVDSLTPEQLRSEFEDKIDPGRPLGPTVRLHIVGVYRRPLDLGDLAASGGVVVYTPAFDQKYAGRMGLFVTILRVRLQNGSADVARASAAAREVFKDNFEGLVDVSAEARGGADAIDVLTIALYTFAGVAAFAGAIAIAIVLSRDLANAEIDHSTLAALGLTRRQCVAALGVRVLVVVAGGAVVALIAAIALSPMFPIGIARRAEIAPGLHIDWLVLGLGLVAVVAFVAVVGFLAARRATRPASSNTANARGAQRSIADLIARAGLRPTASNGVRMALEPGHGTTAIPVRTAFIGAILGVVGLTAGLVFASSLDHLEATPRIYGWNWDFKVPDNTYSVLCGAKDFGLSEVPGVAADAGICYQTGVPIDGRPTTGWGFTPVRGSIEPAIVRGRVPTGPAEVALGATTMRALGKHIGDIVKVQGTKGAFDYRVVGQVVLPPLQAGEIQPLADGAAFSAAGFAPIADRGSRTRYLVGTYAAGVDRAAVARQVGAIRAFNAPNSEAGTFASEEGVSGPTRPPEVDRLRGIDWFPPVLALLVALLALIAVGHALVTTAHRRRSELALLKTFGFRRRQVRATLAWQATMLAVVGLVVGIPLGVLVGTVVWRGIASSLGIASAVVVPALALTLTVPLVLLFVLAVGYWPARAAARVWPAVALATE
jgi:ABC-type antimicrobial peptide transport system permease subunit